MIVLRGIGGKKTFYLNATTAIEWVVAVCTFIGGLYLFTPLYDASVAPATSIVNLLSHPAMVFFWGAVLLIGSLLVILGLVTKQPQFRSAGWFAVIMARTFQILTVLVTVGPLPLTWLPFATLALVALVLWGRARLEVHNAS